MNVLEARNLSKSFDGIECLRDISFTLRSGELLTIRGSNGSGKTTLLDILSGFQPPACGDLIVRNKSSRSKSRSWFGSQGIVRSFQRPRVFEQMTVFDCLTLASLLPHGSPESLGSAFGGSSNRIRLEQARERANSLLKNVGWAERAKSLAGECSYGQRKLIAALQIFLTDGLLCVCDEPTAGLERGRAALVLDLLSKWISKGKDRSCVITTHDLESIKDRSSRVMALRDGVLSSLGGNCESA